MLPRKSDGGVNIKKVMAWLGYAGAILSAISSVSGGFVYVKERLDSIERSAADISMLKDQYEEQERRRAETESRLNKQISRLAEATRERFRQNEVGHQDLRVAVAQMQAAEAARRGSGTGYVITEPDGNRRRVTAREAEREAQEALNRSASSAPDGDPFSGLGL